MSIPTGMGRCPVCLNAALLELVEPDGAALCPECGFMPSWFRSHFAGIKHLLITGQTSFMEVLGMDSLDLVEFVMELEDEFEVTLPDDALARFQTVGDIIRYIVAYWHARIRSDQNTRTKYRKGLNSWVARPESSKGVGLSAHALRRLRACHPQFKPFSMHCCSREFHQGHGGSDARKAVHSSRSLTPPQDVRGFQMAPSAAR